MARNKIEDCRDLLYETMERLLDEQNPLEVARAKAIGDVAKQIISSAKIEADFRLNALKLAGEMGVEAQVVLTEFTQKVLGNGIS